MILWGIGWLERWPPWIQCWHKASLTANMARAWHKHSLRTAWWLMQGEMQAERCKCKSMLFMTYSLCDFVINSIKFSVIGLRQQLINPNFIQWFNKDTHHKIHNGTKTDTILIQDDPITHFPTSHHHQCTCTCTIHLTNTSCTQMQLPAPLSLLSSLFLLLSNCKPFISMDVWTDGNFRIALFGQNSLARLCTGVYSTPWCYRLS